MADTTMMPALPQPRSAIGPAGGGARAAAFDLKGTMAPLTVLRLHSTDVSLIERQLRVKIAQLPQLFLDAPVLFDLGALPAEEGEKLPLVELVRALRLCKVVPVAVANATEIGRARAVDAGLGVLQQPPGSRARDVVLEAADGSLADGGQPGARPVASAYAGPVVVTQPVRSGQVVHARDNDVVVMAPVNPGAQVIADGHVHIYATLRGRAVAGASGLLGARIFCQRLEAELVAVAGAYVMADEIPADRRGKPATISLHDGECRISPL
jgi:septum site-determining protein MinC